MVETGQDPGLGDHSPLIEFIALYVSHNFSSPISVSASWVYSSLFTYLLIPDSLLSRHQMLNTWFYA